MTDPRHRRVHESSYDDEHERSRYFAHLRVFTGSPTPRPLESRGFNNSIFRPLLQPFGDLEVIRRATRCNGRFCIRRSLRRLSPQPPRRNWYCEVTVSDINPSAIVCPTLRARLDAFFERVQDCKGVIEAVDRH